MPVLSLSAFPFFTPFRYNASTGVKFYSGIPGDGNALAVSSQFPETRQTGLSDTLYATVVAFQQNRAGLAQFLGVEVMHIGIDAVLIPVRRYVPLPILFVR